jgi:GNAT superfamily N-acetyltransferase
VANFVPYDDSVHRAQFFELNVEYATWFADEVRALHNFDIVLMLGKSVHEYVETVIDNFTNIRSSDGITYLLEIGGEVEGMGALIKLEEGVGEIKRMYIRPKYQGKGYGKEMLNRLIKKAKELGYSTLQLETADFSTTAHHVYRSAGFKEIAEYHGGETPEWLRPYCLFMEKNLYVI